MAARRLATFARGIELWWTDASPNGSITALTIGSLAVEELAGSVALWQCTVLPNTWVNVGAGGGPGGVPLSNVSASLANTAIDNLSFGEGWEWSTMTTQTGFALAADALTSGNILRVTSTSATQSGHLAEFETASTAPMATGAVHVNATGAHTGVAFQVDSATATGVGTAIITPSLTSGNALRVYSASLTQTGALATFATDSTANMAGGALQVTCGGAHTGIAVAVASATATGQGVSVSTAGLTTGIQYRGSADALTTGSLVDVSTSSVSLNSTNGLLRVANTGVSTTGIHTRLQANNGAETGLTLLANGNLGIGETAPVATIHNAGTYLSVGLAVGDTAAPGMVGGLTAAQSVDISSTLLVAQTTAGALALTLQNPTDTTAGRRIVIVNAGSQAFTMYGVTITTPAAPQTAAAEYVWTGPANGWVHIQ